MRYSVPMRRRTLLAAIGSGMAGVTGCSATSSDSGTPEPTSATSDVGTDTPSTVTETTTSIDSGASSDDGTPLRLLSFDAPDRIELNESARYQFTVENPGEEPRSVQPTVLARPGASGWTSFDSWETVELAPNSQQRFESPEFSFQYLMTVELRVEGFQPTAAIDVTEQQLSFGQGFQDPIGREVRINDLTIKSSYEYTSDGLRRIVELGSGNQFVFLSVEVINRTEDSLQAPPRNEFTLLQGSTTYHSVPLPGSAGYVSEELPWGSRLRGPIAFKTPADLSHDEFRTAWYASFDEGDTGTIWSPE